MTGELDTSVTVTPGHLCFTAFTKKTLLCMMLRRSNEKGA